MTLFPIPDARDYLAERLYAGFCTRACDPTNPPWATLNYMAQDIWRAIAGDALRLLSPDAEDRG